MAKNKMLQEAKNNSTILLNPRIGEGWINKKTKKIALICDIGTSAGCHKIKYPGGRSVWVPTCEFHNKFERI